MPEFEADLAAVAGETSTYDQLIAVANQIIEIARSADQATPVEDVRVGDIPEEAELSLEALITLKQCTTALNAEVQELEGDLILRSRAFNLSWRKIGGVLGISGQGAYSKVSRRTE